jgi:hypothetical protein
MMVLHHISGILEQRVSGTVGGPMAQQRGLFVPVF